MSKHDKILLKMQNSFDGLLDSYSSRELKIKGKYQDAHFKAKDNDR